MLSLRGVTYGRQDEHGLIPIYLRNRNNMRHTIPPPCVSALRAARQRLAGIDAMIRARWSFALASDRSDVVRTIEKLRAEVAAYDQAQLQLHGDEP